MSVRQCASLQLLAQLLFENIVLCLKMSHDTEKKVGGRREIRKKRAWKADYYKIVIEKIGCLSEKEKQHPELGNNE